LGQHKYEIETMASRSSSARGVRFDGMQQSAGLASERIFRDGMHWQVTSRHQGSSASLSSATNRDETPRRPRQQSARRCSEPRVDPATIHSPAGAKSALTAQLVSHYLTPKGRAARAPARCFTVEDMPRKGRGASCPPPRSDPVAHRQVPGLEEKVSTRSMRRVGYHGKNAVGNLTRTSSCASSTAADEVLSSARVLARDDKASRTTRGEVVWNVAGDQDMLPAATKLFNKSDTPATASHRRQNDRGQLMLFEWSPGGKGPNPQLGESPDLRLCPGFAIGAVQPEKAAPEPPKVTPRPARPAPPPAGASIVSTPRAPRSRETPASTAQESFPSRLPAAPAETASLSSRRPASSQGLRRDSSMVMTPRNHQSSAAMREALTCA